MSPRSLLTGTLLLLLLPVPMSHAEASEKARIRLIATGGTISNRPGGRLSVAELAEMVPDLDALVEVETEQFANVASSTLTLDHWLRLSHRINQVFSNDSNVAGIVITCGTDTLEELAYFLHLTIRHERPVVVVGAMRRPGSLGYDGAANLRQAFRVAAHENSRQRGVLVVLNDVINTARDVTKTDAHHLQTFESRMYGALGVVARDGPIYYRAVERRHTSDSEFDIRGVRHLPRVDIVMAYQGASGDLIRAAVDLGADGVIIAGAGAGSTSTGQREAIRDANARGVFTVITTRTGSGRIAPTRPSGNRTSPNNLQRLNIAGEDLSAVKARILLMLALTVTEDAAELQQVFADY